MGEALVVDLQDHVSSGYEIRQRRAACQRRRALQHALMPAAHPQFHRRAEHPFAAMAGDFGTANLRTVAQTRARRCKGGLHAQTKVWGPAHRLIPARTASDRGHAKPGEFRVCRRHGDRIDRDDFGDQDGVDRPGEQLESFHFGGREGEPIGDRLRRDIRKVDEFANPVQRDLHGVQLLRLFSTSVAFRSAKPIVAFRSAKNESFAERKATKRRSFVERKATQFTPRPETAHRNGCRRSSSAGYRRYRTSSWQAA